jgi:deoxyhypusine monooxygenase
LVNLGITVFFFFLTLGMNQLRSPIERVPDQPQELRETCEIALGRILWIASGRTDPPGLADEPRFGSTDPAPAMPEDTPTDKAREILLDAAQDMFTRYTALFLLRNRGGEGEAEGGGQRAILVFFKKKHFQV